jgi:TetR/AcrR family transcriptional regulator
LAQPRTEGTDSRREILRVAEEIFARKGYSPTSTREIAEAAGVTKGLLFYHFQSKQLLYLAVIENLMATLSHLAVPAQMEGIDRKAHVQGFLEGWTDFQAEQPNALKLLTRELMDQGKLHDKIIDEYIKPLWEFGMDFIQAGIDEGVFRPLDPFQFIQMLAASNTMYFMMMPYHERIRGKELTSAEALAHRKRELWRNFSRILERT